VRSFVPRLALVALGLSTAACVGDHGKRRYEFVVRVQSDPGEPLPGAVISGAGRVLGTSGKDGRVRLGAQALEGEVLSLSIRCPPGHRSPSSPLAVVLRRAVDANVRPEYAATCSPETRTLVVAVRAENGAGLPVRHFGRELGRTDASGAAHVVLEADADETVELTLDTSQEPRLRPSSPSARFRVSQRDEVVAFSQRFEIAKDARAARVRPRRGPVRIPPE